MVVKIYRMIETNMRRIPQSCTACQYHETKASYAPAGRCVAANQAGGRWLCRDDGARVKVTKERAPWCPLLEGGEGRGRHAHRG